MSIWATIILTSASVVEDNILGLDISRHGKETGIILVQGKNVFGEQIYCYLKLNMIMYIEVRQKLLAKDKFDLREYGEVIAAGQGIPNYDLIFEIEKTHGMLPVKKE